MYSWENIWLIISKPDNIPILMMIIAMTFYTWYALRDAAQNDKLIAEGRKNEVLRHMQE
jgi:hypothetical protein